MSRRNPIRLRGLRLVICCTDQGRHERVVLGDTHHGNWGMEVIGGSARQDGFRFVCPRCGRDVQMRKFTFGKVAVKLIEAGATHVDISYTHLLT